MHQEMKKEKKEHYEKILFDIASQCSKYERRAEEAERETIKLKKCQYINRNKVLNVLLLKDKQQDNITHLNLITEEDN